MRISEQKILSIIRPALKEDIGSGDITSELILPRKKKIKARILAKENGVVCGLDVARVVFRAVDKRIRFHTKTCDGKKVKKGEILARLEGEARGILKAERVALNFLARLSGIATKTFSYIQRVEPFPVKIMDTRKTTPGLRILEKYAVRCAGGFNHRMGLGDQILVKDNHIKVHNVQQFPVYSLKQLIKEIKIKRPKGIKIEVEVKNLKEFKQALQARPDIIMLDNMSIKEIKKAVQLRNQRSEYRSQKIEVSGGINLDNVRKVAACGVEMISVGELTHSAKALDVALNCE